MLLFREENPTKVFIQIFILLPSYAKLILLDEKMQLSSYFRSNYKLSDKTSTSWTIILSTCPYLPNRTKRTRINLIKTIIEQVFPGVVFHKNTKSVSIVVF